MSHLGRVASGVQPSPSRRGGGRLGKVPGLRSGPEGHPAGTAETTPLLSLLARRSGVLPGGRAPLPFVKASGGVTGGEGNVLWGEFDDKGFSVGVVGKTPGALGNKPDGADVGAFPGKSKGEPGAVGNRDGIPGAPGGAFAPGGVIASASFPTLGTEPAFGAPARGNALNPFGPCIPGLSAALFAASAFRATSAIFPAAKSAAFAIGPARS